MARMTKQRHATLRKLLQVFPKQEWGMPFVAGTQPLLLYLQRYEKTNKQTIVSISFQLG